MATKTQTLIKNTEGVLDNVPFVRNGYVFAGWS